MKRGINTVIFDVGGVLELPKENHERHRTYNLGVHQYIANKLKIDIDLWFDSIAIMHGLIIEGKISKEKFLKTLSETFKVSEKKLEKLLIKAYKRCFKSNKRLYNLAFKLKKQGYTIAILSDQLYFSKKAILKEKILKKFDHVVISCDVKMRKPDIKIYRLLLKKLNVPSKKTVFIDNLPWNLVPAKKLGMKTILFIDNKQLMKDLKKLKVLK